VHRVLPPALHVLRSVLTGDVYGDGHEDLLARGGTEPLMYTSVWCATGNGRFLPVQPGAWRRSAAKTRPEWSAAATARGSRRRCRARTDGCAGRPGRCRRSAAGAGSRVGRQSRFLAHHTRRRRGSIRHVWPPSSQ
jgi:hypothetical protein